MSEISAYLFYAMMWFGFALLHSLLAREVFKQKLKPALGAYYRFIYNGFSVFHLAIVYLAGWWAFSPVVILERPDILHICQMTSFGLGWLLMIIALREYDLGFFSGLKQIRQRYQTDPLEDETLHFKGIHQWVRHPLYTAGFMILWGRVATNFDLMTAICGSLYLWIGSIFEERHLTRMHGEEYAAYKTQVPAFIPWKGRVSLKSS